jgi:hypothetical protein
MNMVSKSRTGRGGVHEIVAAAAKAGRKPLPALLLAVALGACSSTLSSLPPQIGGQPAGTPQQPAAATYPAVHDMPPPRNDVTMTQEEQKKAEAELMALRERQEQQAGALEKANQIIRTDQKIDTRNQ